MRKLLYFIIFLASIASSCIAYDSALELKSFYKIDGKKLIAANNKHYDRFPYESKLHFDLCYKLKDLPLAGQIHNAYKDHLLPLIVQIVEEDDQQKIYTAISKALIEVCHYFGSPDYSPLEPFKKGLRLHDAGNWLEDNIQAIIAFVKQASICQHVVRSRSAEDPFTIVIITSTCSGGNHTAASSIASELERYPNTRIVLIDFEEMAKEFDPVMIATGVYSYDMIYSKILQKRGNLEVNSERKLLSREIQGYIPNNILYELKRKVAALDPDLIISTRSYASDDISLSTLGVPFRLFFPDYELNRSLCSYFRCIPHDSIRFWVPAFQTRMFKPLFEELGSDEKLDPLAQPEELIKKISVTLELSLECAERCFTNIGYPSEKFYPISDKNALKNKWGVAEDEIPVFVMMGKNGADSMQKIFDDLNLEESTLRLKIFFLCGNNSELVERLHKKARRSIVVCGILTPDEVNEVMNICSIGISKAGGATVSEAIASKTPLLLMDSFPWEEANAQHLVELGLAVRFNPKCSLVTQIADAIQLLSDNTISIDDWRIRLHQQVKPLIQ